MIFSDIYADRRVPAALLKDPVHHGECLAGALYRGDFERLARSAGLAHPRLVSHHHIERGRVFPVCGNTWKMVGETRFADHFEFSGDFSTHFGVFAGCGTESRFMATAGGDGVACC